MNATPGVLIIDDDPAVCSALSRMLAPAFQVHIAASGEDGLAQFERVRPDIVLLDLMLPQMGGLAVLRALKRSSADLPVIMMTGFADVTAVQAIKLGALDYLQKPLDCQVVLHRVEQAVARPPAAPPPARAQVVGESMAMKHVWRVLERFGPTDVPILLQGETGTGKGLFAEAIHQLSNRARGPFVAIDCTTIPPDLAESELFGYEDGAFTGAGKRKRGRVAFADRGTLFLDEIGTLAVGTQCKLLTLVERQNFLPLGARHIEPTHLDVRFISATNVPLAHAVEEGTFRADLFHRLNGITVELPPLRDRGNDIALLARHFVGEFARRQGKPGLELSSEALEVLQHYAWPGNVRELQHVLSVAVVTASDTLTADDLADHLRTTARTRAERVQGQADVPPTVSGAATAMPINLREIKEWAGREAQRRVILELQSRTNISRQDLARMLGVDTKTLRSRLKEISSEDSKIRPAS